MSGVKLRSVSYATKIDEVSSSLTYIGKADLGSVTSDAVWQIQRISVSSTVTTISWASGNDRFDKIWDNRAALVYS